jgi:crotonobetainyl-CoA:carnitine CoA-transferase CaiB-like acyl-CoA transferase
VTVPGTDPDLSEKLRALVDELEAAGDVATRAHAVAALGRADVSWDDVARFVDRVQGSELVEGEVIVDASDRSSPGLVILPGPPSRVTAPNQVVLAFRERHTRC